MEKYVKNFDGINYAAILYSPGYGAGWSTWEGKELAYDKRVVEWLIQNATLVKPEFPTQDIIGIDTDEFEKYLDSIGYKGVYMGGADDLTIYWVKTGQSIYIDEYDGLETIHFVNEMPIIEV